ncbi:MAG: 30S ribosomal protein S20 [Bacillota bacterium]
MANNKSAEKRARVSERKQARNKSAKSALRTAVKRYETEAAGKDPAAIGELWSKTQRIIDQTAAKGVVHRNTAARLKSKLARAAVRGK